MVQGNMLMATATLTGRVLGALSRGTHVHVSGKHLQKYVKEFEYRYNMRQNPGRMFDRLLAAF